MSCTSDSRPREYPGNRFSKRIIEQDLNELAEELRDEEFGEGHSEKGHNQIELYRHNATTVSLFMFEQGGHLPEHSVEDGSAVIRVLKRKLCF